MSESSEAVGREEEGVADFFLGEVIRQECDVCSKVTVGVPLGEETTSAVLRVLLLPPGEADGRRRGLRLCGDCISYLDTLTDLAAQLEERRVKFNALRRRFGRGVLVGWLGGSEAAVERWEEQLSAVETFFPSCVELETEEEEIRMEFKEEEIRMEFMEDSSDFVCESEEGDPKLETMSAVVLLERLEERSLQAGRGRHLDVVGDLSGGDSVTPEREEEESRGECTRSETFLSRRAVEAAMDSLLSSEVSSDEEDAHPLFSTSSPIHPSLENPLVSPQSRNLPATSGRHSCPKCEKKFAFKSSVGRHVRVVHSHHQKTAGVRHPCPICDATFSRPHDVKRHVLRFHNQSTPSVSIQPREFGPQRRFACSSCSTSYGTARHLRRHQLDVHAKRIRPSPSCPPESFRRDHQPQTHLRETHNYNPAETTSAESTHSASSQITEHCALPEEVVIVDEVAPKIIPLYEDSATPAEKEEIAAKWRRVWTAVCGVKSPPATHSEVAHSPKGPLQNLRTSVSSLAGLPPPPPSTQRPQQKGSL